MNILIPIAHEEGGRLDTEDAYRAAQSVKIALDGMEWQTQIVPIKYSLWKKDPHRSFNQELFLKADCIVNFFEGFSEDSAAEIQFSRILERLGVPFTGNKSRSLQICLYKNTCRTLLGNSGIKVPKGVYLSTNNPAIAQDLSFPVFIKPRREDASIGIDNDSFCPDIESLKKSILKKLACHRDGLIVEEFIDGLEYSASFMGQKNVEMVALSTINYETYPTLKPFLTYASKWDDTDPSYNEVQPSVSVDSSSDLWKEIADIGHKITQTIGCSGYFRIDFREKNGVLYVIDVNPNPDLNEDAGFAKHAYAAGYSYTQIITKLISEARKELCTPTT